MDNGASSYRRFLDGDESGFVEIIEQYGANLILFINGFVNNLTVAEDLMEETFCDLIFYKNRFKGKSLFKTYLFKIARNKAIDYIKKISHYECLPIEDFEKQLSEINNLENIVFINDDKKQLYSAMNKIKLEYKSVLHLLYLEDMTYDEAALVLKKNNKQIKNLAYRAKQSLKVVMEKEGLIYEK